MVPAHSKLSVGTKRGGATVTKVATMLVKIMPFHDNVL